MVDCMLFGRALSLPTEEERALYLASFGRKNLDFQGTVRREASRRFADNRARELGRISGGLVELIGIEPTTSGLQSPRSPS
jgi:hypothetical protein